METWFKAKNDWECDAISGSLNGSSYNIWGIKEPDYTMKIMATGGVQEEGNNCKMTWCRTCDSKIGFMSKKHFDWHFCYRHAVSGWSQHFMPFSTIKDTWVTQRWYSSFCFPFFNHRGENIPGNASFCMANRGVEGRTNICWVSRALSWKLANNQYLVHEARNGCKDKGGIEERHQAVTTPPHAKEYFNCRWVCTALSRYQWYVFKVKGCKNRLELVVHVNRSIGYVIHISWSMQQSVWKLCKVMVLNSMRGFLVTRSSCRQ